jgi:hypothetical protein
LKKLANSISLRPSPVPHSTPCCETHLPPLLPSLPEHQARNNKLLPVIEAKMSRSILVTGATGKQGGALIKALLASPRHSDFTIYALSRSSDSPSAKKLAAQGENIKLVQGDLDHVEAIFKAAPEPYWGVFSMQVRLHSSFPTILTKRKKSN